MVQGITPEDLQQTIRTLLERMGGLDQCHGCLDSAWDRDRIRMDLDEAAERADVPRDQWWWRQ